MDIKNPLNFRGLYNHTDVNFSDETKLHCTPYHKFYIQNNYSHTKGDILKSKNVEVIEAKNLKPDLKIVKCEYPIINSEKRLKNAYTNGLFSGDGTYGNISKIKPRKCKFTRFQKEFVL